MFSNIFRRLSFDDLAANDSLNMVRKRKVGVHVSGLAFLNKKIKIVDSNAYLPSPYQQPQPASSNLTTDLQNDDDTTAAEQIKKVPQTDLCMIIFYQ